MNKQNKVVKPVSFNLNREDEAELFKHVKRRNFSGYVKKLIAADLLQRKEEKAQERATEMLEGPPLVVEVKTAAQKLQELKQRINQQEH